MHVVLLRGIAGKNTVNFVGGEERFARVAVAEHWRIRSAHFVDERANPRETRGIIGLAKIDRAADL